MGDRPTGDHHHTHHHLHLAWLAVTAVPVLGQRRSRAFEVRARQVIEHPLRIEIEQHPQPFVQRHFNRLFVQQQMIQRAIPALQLRQVDLHAATWLPARHIAAAVAVAAVIRIEPIGQGVFARRPRQAVGDQHPHTTHPIVVRVLFGPQLGPPPARIEPVPKRQLIEEVARHEHRPPRAGVKHFDRTSLPELPSRFCLIDVPLEKPIEHRQDGFERLASPEVGDDLLLDFSVFPYGTDDADILVDGAVGGGNFDGSDEQGQRSSHNGLDCRHQILEGSVFLQSIPVDLCQIIITTHFAETGFLALKNK